MGWVATGADNEDTIVFWILVTWQCSASTDTPMHMLDRLRSSGANKSCYASVSLIMQTVISIAPIGCDRERAELQLASMH